MSRMPVAVHSKDRLSGYSQVCSFDVSVSLLPDICDYELSIGEMNN